MAKQRSLLDRGEVVVASRDGSARYSLPATCAACAAPATEHRTVLKHGYSPVEYEVSLIGVGYCGQHAPTSPVVQRHWPGIKSIGLSIDRVLIIRFARPEFARSFAIANADAVARALDSAECARAIELLAEIGDARAIPLHVDLISGKQLGKDWPRKVQEWARALDAFGDHAVDALLALMDGREPDLPAGADNALFKLSLNERFGWTVRGRRTPAASRLNAVVALGELDDPRVPDVLAAVLRDAASTYTQRLWAANGLARFRDRSDIADALARAAASDPDEHVRKMAKRALKGKHR